MNARTNERKNRIFVLDAALGALILFGFNYYQTAQVEAQVTASELYDDLTEQVVAGDVEAADAVAQDLAANHGGSSYAAQSHLAMARLYMDKNRDIDAAQSLRDLLAMDGHEPFKHVARLRLAKVLLKLQMQIHQNYHHLIQF